MWLGDYIETPEYAQYDPTLAGIGGQLGMGLLGLDLPLDIRDLSYSLSHWEWTWGHVGITALNLLAFIPVVGMVKHGDELGDLLRHSDEVAELANLGATAQRGISEAGSEALDDAIRLVRLTKPASAMSPVAASQNYRANLAAVWPIPKPQFRIDQITSLWEAHHIIPHQLPQSRIALEYVESLGIHRHSPANLTWLPGTGADAEILRRYYEVIPIAHRGEGIHTTTSIPTGMDLPNVIRLNEIFMELKKADAIQDEVLEALV